MGCCEVNPLVHVKKQRPVYSKSMRDLISLPEEPYRSRVVHTKAAKSETCGKPRRLQKDKPGANVHNPFHLLDKTLVLLARVFCGQEVEDVVENGVMKEADMVAFFHDCRLEEHIKKDSCTEV